MVADTAPKIQAAFMGFLVLPVAMLSLSSTHSLQAKIKKKASKLKPLWR
jgi:hypothetical protein